MAAATPDLWTLLDDPPDGLAGIADLYSWSLNYEARTGSPFGLYLDLIGWSLDELGESLTDLARLPLGYVELDKLTAALAEYVSQPQEAREFAARLVDLEARP